jgi:hypothetical protein
MRNVIGQFKKNVLCKYDLKGSSLNRKINFEIDNVHKIVMKDLNFDEIEKCLLLSKVDIERLRFACMTDAYFLNDMDIMDYSLFVVKISLNREEIEELFGEQSSEHIEKDLNVSNVSGNISSLNSIDGKSRIFTNISELEHYKKYLFRSLNGKIVYVIAIIDYLQIYNFYKYLETNFKLLINNRPEKKEEISCVPPEEYCNRFIDYVKKITQISDINITIT